MHHVAYIHDAHVFFGNQHSNRQIAVSWDKDPQILEKKNSGFRILNPQDLKVLTVNQKISQIN